MIESFLHWFFLILVVRWLLRGSLTGLL